VEFCVRYKVWRSNKDKSLHLLCAEASEALNALPAAVRSVQVQFGCVASLRLISLAR
jgi:hypothetical protein